MGFLSRKKKNREPAVLEETHPLEEELQGMEEAVPERPVDDYEPEYVDDLPLEQDDIDVSAPTAGPVADDEVAAAAQGFEPSRTEEPQLEPVRVEEEPRAEAPVPTGGVKVGSLRVEEALNAERKNDDEESGDARMKAVDLIAPDRKSVVWERVLMPV